MDQEGVGDVVAIASCEHFVLNCCGKKSRSRNRIVWKGLNKAHSVACHCVVAVNSFLAKGKNPFSYEFSLSWSLCYYLTKYVHVEYWWGFWIQLNRTRSNICWVNRILFFYIATGHHLMIPYKTPMFTRKPTCWVNMAQHLAIFFHIVICNAIPDKQVFYLKLFSFHFA